MAMIKKIPKFGDHTRGEVADNLTAFDKDGNVVSYRTETSDVGKVFGIGATGIPQLLAAPGGTVVDVTSSVSVPENFTTSTLKATLANGMVYISGTVEYTAETSPSAVYVPILTIASNIRPATQTYLPVTIGDGSVENTIASVVGIQANGTIMVYKARTLVKNSFVSFLIVYKAP